MVTTIIKPISIIRKRGKKIKEYLVDYLDNKKLNLHNFFISGIKVTITKIKKIKCN